MKRNLNFGWLSLFAVPLFLALAASPGPSPTPSFVPVVPIHPGPVLSPGPVAPTPAVSAHVNPARYFIHPYAVPNQCLGYALAGPFNGQYVVNAVMDACGPNDPKYYWAVNIQNYNDGSDWDGKSNAKVVIKSTSLGSCLENALADGLPPNGGDWEYDGCASKTPTSRYVFHIYVNSYGAVQIQSDRDQKCLERNGPNNVLALACTGLNNWMVEKVPG